MYEHGLGIPRDYELAWTYYDQARNSEYADDRTDADQGLDGMPIELLVLLAKGRCVCASIGRVVCCRLLSCEP